MKEINRKGFTLVEMLAVIVILSIIMGIATYGVIGTINNSKLKNEKNFTNRISTIIDEYIALNGYKLEEVKEYSVKDNDNKIKQLESIKILDLIKKNLIDVKKLVNPANKKQCFVDDNSLNTEIIIFKDKNHVYYYYTELNNTNCEISKENQLISNIPNDMIKILKDSGANLPEALTKKVG